MLITRTPFRISFAGGGSDLESFYAREPGAVLSTAINKYMYLSVNERFGNGFRISYSRTELVDDRDQVEHPIVRQCLRDFDIRRGLEIVSIADLPAQSGMGSSSSFTVGLLHALHTLEGRFVTANHLAEQASEIEIEKLGEPIGKQDQYIAAHGGLQFIRFQSDGSVCVDPVVCPRETRRELNRRLLLFFTGQTRNARDVLTRQKANINDRLPVLRKLCQIAYELRDLLVRSDLPAFGHLLNEAWEEKKKLETSISNSEIDTHYQRGLGAGALGGKLLGAGSGGFLLFFCEPERQCCLREALKDLIEVPFELEPEGTKVIFLGKDR